MRRTVQCGDLTGSCSEGNATNCFLKGTTIRTVVAPAEKPPARVPAQAPNGGSLDTKTPSEFASLDRPSRSEVASDEICKRDEDRLQRLPNSQISDEAMRFLNELRAKKPLSSIFAAAHAEIRDGGSIAAPAITSRRPYA
jgi:hypothetical protein